MKALAPLHLKDEYFAHIEAEINRLLFNILYEPLLITLGIGKRQMERELKNARDPLLEAITRGDIWYENGQFKGKFNARTSAAIIKLGGKFNVPSKTYSLPKSKLPLEYKFAQVNAQQQYEQLRQAMLSAIDNMDANMVDKLSKLKDEYEKTLGRMETDLQGTLPMDMPLQVDNPAAAVSRVAIEARLTAGQRQAIAKNWAENLDLYIKGWTEENILKLRQDIQPHVLAGGRAEGLRKVLEDNYGVSKRKARFLARQETALLMSEFQETKYLDLGLDQYRWSDSHDRRVRHDHHGLNGKVFSWRDPPVTNKKTGARNHPGKDFGCRCVAIPLL